MKINFILSLLVVALFTSCSDSSEVDTVELSQTLTESTEVKIHSANLQELSDEEYPDNPDITIRHPKYVETTMETISFEKKENGFDIVIYPSNENDDTVIMKNIALMEFMPSIPNCAKGNEYMSLISVVNQEWNRNQVKWKEDELQKVITKNYTVNGETITRIDLARNCLNAYLWEVFFSSKVDGKDKVFYHGWFNFPKELYQELFKERNGENFNQYAGYLENWKNPENNQLSLEEIRTVTSSKAISFVNHDQEMYPLKGERKKKEIDIIYPVHYTKMADFHTDSALFATFSIPGFYNRKDPRTTELGRFYNLKSIEYRKTKSTNDIESDELKMLFERENGEVTQFIFGGLDFSTLPRLSVEECNSGISFPMGIGNHPFYEDNLSHELLNSRENPYLGILLDENGNWIDSHKIGIDGPLLHLDKEDPTILHVWLLSFERQALVGHYEVQL